MISQNFKPEKFLGSSNQPDLNLLQNLVASYNDNQTKNILLLNGNNTESNNLLKILLNIDIKSEDSLEDDTLEIIKTIGSLERGENEISLFNVKTIQDLEVERSREIFFSLALGFSDFLIFNFHWSEFLPPSLYFDSKMKSIFAKLQSLVEATETITQSSKKIFIAIRDSENLETSESEIRTNIMEKCSKIKDELIGQDLKKVSIELIFLPNHFKNPKRFEELILQSETFKEIDSKTQTLSNDFVASGQEEIFKVVEKIAQNQNLKNLDSSLVVKETVASIATNKIFDESMETFEKAIEIWESCTEDGSLIQNLGKESEKLIHDGVEYFKDNAIIYSNSQSYKTKIDILEKEMISKLEDIYYRQVQKLKELCFQSFKDSLASIQVNSNVESEVKAAVKVTEKYFKSKKDILRPKMKGFEINDTKDTYELSSRIREMATERLQAARLQGVYLQKNKHPISMAFHFLHPHPFGKDSRFDNLGMNDTMNYNPNLSKRAGLMRQFANDNSGIKNPMESPDSKSQREVDLIYREEPLQSFQNNS